MNKYRPSRLSSLTVFLGLSLLAAGCGREDKPAERASPAQASPPAGQPQPAPAAAAPGTPAPPAAAPGPAPAAAVQPLTEMESLVAPIALYPDPLLAEMLVASTYPLEVVQASRWAESKPDLGTLKDKDWDASIMRLADVPQVLKMMSDHLDWTTRLGDTFLAQPDELMNSIQLLRRRAKESGFLKDTPEQKVSTKTERVRQAEELSAEGQEVSGGGAVSAQPAVVRQEVVYIEPAQSDKLYVPQYNPEAAYAAPLAQPPGGSGQYPSATTAGYAAPGSGYSAPAAGYYPGYYPTTTTTSSNNDLMTFGLGAVAGGLLTWGIMEWADDDDWDDYYHGRYYPPVSHYYGGAVCRNGNCWNGGGNWDRGNVNYDRNVTISGNEINVDRSRTFSQDQLAGIKTKREGWTHDVQHRRGATYPENVKEKIGRVHEPALAGSRLGSAQTLPANVRGFAGKGERPAAERRPSADEVRQSLSSGAKLRDSQIVKEKPAARPAQARPDTSDIRQRLGQGQRPNALEGLHDSGRLAKAEQSRGAESRQKIQSRARADQADLAGRDRERQRPTGMQPKREKLQERRPERPQSQGRRDFSQARNHQARIERTRPNAFEGARESGQTRNFAQRGAASRQKMAARPQSGGAGASRFQGGGGGGFSGARGGGGGTGFSGARGGGGGGGGRLKGRR